ncbi:MAG: DUF4831 family protein [Prevotellaceae bacterium]|jgi:hypothetical protein|nr:DUF4831 family protein [Prevotellaceae bacterium]
MNKIIFTLAACFMTICGMGQKLSSSSAVPSGAMVYALPSTTIEVEVEIVREAFIPGPYAEYADAYLSIADVPRREGTNYSIQNVSIRPLITADYEAMYAVPTAGKTVQTGIMTLSSEGLIFAGSEAENLKTSIDVGTPIKNFQYFTDRLPSSPLETKRTSMYDRVKTDSGFIHVPYQQSIINEKDPEHKAEEASKFIYALRKRRFELITGDVDNAFAGSSLKDAINEIRRLENEYLSLFCGKSSITTRVYKFYVVPEKTKNKASYNVFRFSESEGVSDENLRGTRAITLEVIPLNRTRFVDGINTEGGSKVATLYYRVPETANIQLMDGGKELCRGTVPVYQIGKEFGIPADALFK